MRSTAGLARPALSAGRDLGRQGRQFRAVLGACRKGRAVPVRSARAITRKRASCCPNTPTRSGTAICPRRARACFTATACTAPTIRPTGTASIRTSCCSTPMRKALSGAAALERRAVRLPGRQPARGSVVRPPRQRAPHAEMPRRRERLHLERRPPPAHLVGRDDHLEMHVRGFTIRHPRCRAARTAAPSRRSPRRRSSTTWSSSASPRSSCCRSRPPIDRTPGRRARAGELLGLQHDRVFRARSALSAGRRRSPSSRPRSSACTRPGSRSFSTSSTTTPARAISSGRRCRSAASTISPITGCRPTAASIRT